jgi:hypothetical protein
MPAFNQAAVVGGDGARRIWLARWRLTGKRGGLTRAAGSYSAGGFSPASARAYAYDEAARDEELAPERVHEIVREALARRIVEDETDLQFATLTQATQIASAAVANGDPQSARSARPLPVGRQGQSGL